MGVWALLHFILFPGLPERLDASSTHLAGDDCSHMNRHRRLAELVKYCPERWYLPSLPLPPIYFFAVKSVFVWILHQESEARQHRLWRAAGVTVHGCRASENGGRRRWTG